MRNVKGHIPLDLLYNLILFILYFYHFVNSLPLKYFSFIFPPPIYLHWCHSHTDTQTDRQTQIQTQRYKDRQAGRQTHIQTPKYIQTHRRTCKCTHAYTCKHAHSSVEPYRSYFHYICNNFLLISFPSA